MEKVFNKGNRDAKPDRIAVNSVMSALARNGELQRVVQLQNRMEEVYDIAPGKHFGVCLVQEPTFPERALEILTQIEEGSRKATKKSSLTIPIALK
jgi:pentatricopeptide repeat protein